MIGRMTTAVEYASEESSPWGALRLIAGNANPALAQRISDKIGGVRTRAKHCSGRTWEWVGQSRSPSMAPIGRPPCGGPPCAGPIGM